MLYTVYNIINARPIWDTRGLKSQGRILRAGARRAQNFEGVLIFLSHFLLFFPYIIDHTSAHIINRNEIIPLLIFRTDNFTVIIMYI